MKKRLSLRWQLTLLTALLVTTACLTLSLLISRSAILYMDEIGNSVITVLPEEALAEADSGNADIYLNITGDLSGQIHDTQSEFWMKSLAFTFALVIIMSLLTYFLVGSALRPLKSLGLQIEEIQAGNMQKSIHVSHASSEIEQLTDAFNDMLKRLDEAFTVQRHFSANAAHELRTPLAVMQTRLEVLGKENSPSAEDYAETIEMVHSETGRLSHVIDILLEMTEVTTAAGNESISLSELIEEVLCDLTPLSEKKNVTLLQNPGDAQITGSDTLIYRAVYNLVENAIKYNHPEGSVTVSVQCEQDHAAVLVADTGPGILESDWNRIFDPFFRVDKSRSRRMGGAGLGLALVKEIAARHGGTVRVLQSSPSGTTIELSLPLS